jgi:putative ABC transport system permease protein
LSGQSSGTDFKIEGLPEPPPGEWPVTAIRVTSRDYFRTVRTPLLKGRTFTKRDHADAPAVAVINKTLADRFWPGQDPIGKRLAYSWDDLVSVEVVGVVGDVRHDGLDADHVPATFRPHAQMPARFMNLVVRTTGDPERLAPVIRSEVQAIDPAQPIAEVRTLESIVARSIGQPRFNTLLLGQFAALALLLAAVGIYGVMSDFVIQRTNEIGVRMALGARAADVLKMVLRKGLALVILGLGIGLAGAFALTRLLESLLFGITAADLATYVGVTFLLSLVAVVAILLPALRATRVDPLAALHYE